MRGEIVDLAAFRKAKANPTPSAREEDLRAKVPARYRGVLGHERWMEKLAAKVRIEMSEDLTPEELVAISAIVAGLLERRSL